MKIFKHKNIMGMIYGVVLAIPLLSVLVRSAYVVVNKNSYQNYSGELETQQTYINDVNDLVVDDEYYFKSGRLTSEGMLGGYEQYIEYEYVETITNNTSLDLSQYNAIGFYSSGTEVYYYLNVVGETFDTNSYFTFLDDVEFKFIYKGNDLIQSNNILNHSDNIFSVTLLQNGYLDNAFDYSLSKYVDENSFGKLNFFEWFFNIFMDSNQQNNLYIRYVNWYMNYILLVSCSYILFLVLMWFVNYSRRILERGLDYDW